jgi:hypothetical protein
MLCRGFSEANGSWKTICMRRRSGRSSCSFSVEMSRPSKMMRPSVGLYRRKMVRPTVDFPQPDSPTRPTVSPRLIVSEMSSTARMSPTWRSSTIPLLIGK